MKPTILLISILTLAACTAAPGGWRAVETADDLLTGSLHSALEDGRPLECRAWTEFSIEMFNYFLSDATRNHSTEFVCTELTWDISPEREVSDGGKERLTIWYVRRGDRTRFRQDIRGAIPAIWSNPTLAPDAWLPLLHKKWNTDTQF